MSRQSINPDGLFDSEQEPYRYSQAVIMKDTLYLSGQIGVDADMNVVGPDVKSQTRKAFENVEVTLEEVDKDLSDVAKVRCFILDMEENMEPYKEVFGEYFSKPYPCHTAIGAGELGGVAEDADDILLELEVDVPL